MVGVMVINHKQLVVVVVIDIRSHTSKVSSYSLIHSLACFKKEKEKEEECPFDIFPLEVHLSSLSFSLSPSLDHSHDGNWAIGR